MQKLKSLTSEQLLDATKAAVAQERKSTAEVVRHFQEIYERRLYLELGYPSLFEMAVRHFGYCNSSAQSRINSMRLIQALPEVEVKIETGELSLTAAASVQSFFYQEAKTGNTYSKSEKLELVQTCLKKSTREVERELARRNPERDKRELIKPISEERFHLSFSVSAGLNSKIGRLKSLLSHSDPNMSMENLLERMTEIALEKHDPERRALRIQKRIERAQNSSTSAQEEVHAEQPVTSLRAREVEYKELKTRPQHQEGSKAVGSQSTNSDLSIGANPVHQLRAQEEKPRSRYIDQETKRAVWAKNRNRGCEYIDKRSGQACGSKHFLQIDHIVPYSHGGTNEAQNLRLLCSQHNRWRWDSRMRSSVNARVQNYA